jgi:hypothetical protein
MWGVGILLMLGGGAVSVWAWDKGKRDIDFFASGVCLTGVFLCILDM